MTLAVPIQCIFTLSKEEVMYRRIVFPALCRQYPDPEDAHDRVLRLLARVGNSPALARLVHQNYAVNDDRLEVRCMGLKFPNPVGIAGGFDKNGVAVLGLQALGFGFIEIGTVTPLLQKGYDRPRIHRLVKDKAFVNKMGFPNIGKDGVAQNLKDLPKGRRVPLFANVGRGIATPNENAAQDYVGVMKALFPYVDGWTVNVSSPNTPGIRELQEAGPLDALLSIVWSANVQLCDFHGLNLKPILVKISPDMTDEQTAAIACVCVARKMSGIIATNTSIGRTGVTTPTTAEGGLSGKPNFYVARNTVRLIRSVVPEDFVIVGVGGIFDAEDAYEMFKAGATLVQGYTGFVYEGPAYVRNMNRGLLEMMNRVGIWGVDHIYNHGATSAAPVWSGIDHF